MQEFYMIVNMPQYGWNVLIGREYAWLYLRQGSENVSYNT